LINIGNRLYKAYLIESTNYFFQKVIRFVMISPVKGVTATASEHGLYVEQWQLRVQN